MRGRSGGLVALVAAGAAAAALSGCGGGGSSAGVLLPAVGAGFLASGSAAGANLVRLREVASEGDIVMLEVVVGGPTLSGELYGFAFDLVLGDGSLGDYVEGSAALGPALNLSSCEGASLQVAQIGDRIVVGVSKLGDCSGNGISAGEEPAVLRLSMRIRRAGSSPLAFGGPTGRPAAALMADGEPIDTIRFDAVASTLVGS